MPDNVLTTAATAGTSSDVVVTDPVTLHLKDAEGDNVPSNAVVYLEIKDDQGQYFRVDTLSKAKPGVVVVGPGTYRVNRPAGPAVGVFSG